MGSKKKADNKKKPASKRIDGAKEIERAEKRLARAIAGVNEAREKVARRERDLADVLTRHGHTAPASNHVDLAIPLEAPASPALENRLAHDGNQVDAEHVDAEAANQHE